MDGGLGHAFAVAVIITLGMFFPCFLLTIAGHSLLEKLVRNNFLSAFFDGLCGAVIGVIAIIAAQFLHSSVAGSADTALADRVSDSGPAAVLYLLTLASLYRFTNKYTTLLIVICAAVAGQFIFLPQNQS
ncbi:hypothetical protein BDZ85DRAFT_280585 [Elsinoe ampelina]|uniref:Chromate transporter n=1 Tax=Elsinoe ampelina TaxID=302913 RepID=A0A6A6GE23_9PEZI|nr:hypothetical protein BDZ85DRAFT_280585 [Elsinoe ampelina]